jgi:hypothetical protein
MPRNPKRNLPTEPFAICQDATYQPIKKDDDTVLLRVLPAERWTPFFQHIGKLGRAALAAEKEDAN